MKCPCHSGLDYDSCCRPYHEGTPAPTAEALMRSRYSAYALGLVDYIIQTTHPQHPHSLEETALRAFSESTEFVALSIIEHMEEGDRAIVLFHAGLKQGGRDASFQERSLFLRQLGRWLYVKAE